MYTTKTLTVDFSEDDDRTNAVSFMETDGIVYPVAIICPAALDGTLFRIERETVPNGGTYGVMRAPGSGADFPYTFSANGIIPIDGDTIKALKGAKIRIVTATAQTADRDFILEYERL